MFFFHIFKWWRLPFIFWLRRVHVIPKVLKQQPIVALISLHKTTVALFPYTVFLWVGVQTECDLLTIVWNTEKSKSPENLNYQPPHTPTGRVVFQLSVLFSNSLFQSTWKLPPGWTLILDFRFHFYYPKLTTLRLRKQYLSSHSLKGQE